jgi:hypothetical protein
MPSFAQNDKPMTDQNPTYAELLNKHRYLIFGKGQTGFCKASGIHPQTLYDMGRAIRDGREFQSSRRYLYQLADTLAKALILLDADLTAADARMGRKHKMRRLDRRPENPVVAWRRNSAKP